jgi:hypothetical protein
MDVSSLILLSTSTKESSKIVYIILETSDAQYCNAGRKTLTTQFVRQSDTTLMDYKRRSSFMMLLANGIPSFRGG